MKKTRFLLFVLTIATLLLSACGAAATPNTGGGRPQPIPVAFVGVVDSMAGDQWVINGTTVTVDPAVVRDGPFNVGDQVKVEGLVNSDGSFSVSRVEGPTPEDLSTLPSFGDNSNDANVTDDNGNDGNANDGNINDDNGNAANSNEDDDDSNTNDDNGNDANTNDDDDDNSNTANSNEEDDDSNSNDDDSNSNDNGSDDDNSSSGGNDDSGGGNNGNDGGDDDDSGGGGNDNDDD